ncbi:hypothetical protein DVH05_010500 [Phytophthora capsici]|nr:hypothetical protein DVH05_009618 [Phytophthora capsici]KAG1702011.1 hypothetical protein DVH05_010500 [Phytophthora capsici]
MEPVIVVQSVRTSLTPVTYLDDTVQNIQVRSFPFRRQHFINLMLPTGPATSSDQRGPQSRPSTPDYGSPRRPFTSAAGSSPVACPRTGNQSHSGVPDRQDAAAGLLAISGRRVGPTHDHEANAAPDRTRSAGSRSSYVRSDQRNVPLANPNIAPLPLDVSTLRSSLAAIETALEREGAFQQLRQDYADLQQQLRSAEDHVQDLENQFRQAAQLASPFVQYCQHRYNTIRHDLGESRRQFEEVVAALAAHEGDRIRIADLENQLQNVQQQHGTVIDGLNQTISSLTDQLAAALLQTPTASYQDLQRLRAELNSSIAVRADLQQALNQAIAARDQLQDRLDAEINDHMRTRQQLVDSQDTNNALAASQDALEGAADQLKRQLASVQQNLVQLRMSADANLDLVISQRNQVRDERDRARVDLQNRDTQLRRARSDRDRARDELQSYRKFLVCSSRTQ